MKKLYFQAKRYRPMNDNVQEDYRVPDMPRRATFEEAQRDLETFPPDPVMEIAGKFVDAYDAGDTALHSKLHEELIKLRYQFGGYARDVVVARMIGLG